MLSSAFIFSTAHLNGTQISRVPFLIRHSRQPLHILSGNPSQFQGCKSWSYPLHAYLASLQYGLAMAGILTITSVTAKLANSHIARTIQHDLHNSRSSIPVCLGLDSQSNQSLTPNDLFYWLNIHFYS